MIVRVLGSAAGGGVPQWNCACRNCAAARAGRAPARTESGFAVSADGTNWWLINASGDLAQQFARTAALWPSTTRGTPLAGILLTDANVDHIGGFAVMRQGGECGFEVYSSAPVRALAGEQPMLRPFLAAPHRWESVPAGGAVTLGRELRATAIAVPGLLPGYAGRAADPEAVYAWAIEDERRGGRVLFAPIFAALGRELLAQIGRSPLALVDGTFWSDDELASVGVAKRASDLGHLPIGGDLGSLRALAPLAAAGTRVVYAHLNNTNPALRPESAAAEALAAAGIALAADGDEWML
ncbi:MAG: pyrroloquinoline quinone biosynthesis protein PqqB [Vulcanimicrobiaceae bacterium]